MRPITREEREYLCRRAGDQELVDFVYELQELSRKYRMPQRQLLSIWLHAPQPTDFPEAKLLAIRNKLATRGVEPTPAEVRELSESLFCKIRNHLRDAGYHESSIPDSDQALVALLKSL